MTAMNYEVPILHVEFGKDQASSLCATFDNIGQQSSMSSDLVSRPAEAVIEIYLRHESVLEQCHMRHRRTCIKSSRHLLLVGQMETPGQSLERFQTNNFVPET